MEAVPRHRFTFITSLPTGIREERATMATYARFNKFEETFGLPAGEYKACIEIGDAEPRTYKGEPVFLKGVVDGKGNPVQDTTREYRIYLIDHKVYYKVNRSSGQTRYLLRGIGKKLLPLVPESKILSKLAELEFTLVVGNDEKFGLQLDIK